jgi:hypothetical protein
VVALSWGREAQVQLRKAHQSAGKATSATRSCHSCFNQGRCALLLQTCTAAFIVMFYEVYRLKYALLLQTCTAACVGFIVMFYEVYRLKYEVLLNINRPGDVFRPGAVSSH